MGHALAYSAGLRAGLPQPVLDVYESSVIRQDSAWYSEVAELPRIHQRINEDKAISSMLPHLETYLDRLDISPYVNAPIVSDANWKSYLQELPVYSGRATVVDLGQIQAML